MVRGAFRHFAHDHHFEALPSGTRMIDIFEFTVTIRLNRRNRGAVVSDGVHVAVSREAWPGPEADGRSQRGTGDQMTRWTRISVAALTVSLTAGFTPVAARQVAPRYVSAAVDSAGELRIVAADGRTVTIRKEGEQPGFKQIAISPAGDAVGWVGTSYEPFRSTSMFSLPDRLENMGSPAGQCGPGCSLRVARRSRSTRKPCTVAWASTMSSATSPVAVSSRNTVRKSISIISRFPIKSLRNGSGRSPTSASNSRPRRRATICRSPIARRATGDSFPMA